MFDEHPELVELFPFGEDSKDPKTGKLKINARTKRHLVAQASAVMRVVGTCVAGLASIEDLVPRLRSVGTTHKIVGVQTMHYDILYRHLVNGIKEEVGPQNWDDETENAWEQAYLSITDLMKRPSKRLETEPLKGWGLVMLLACLYFTIVTPIRFAGFFIGRQYIITTLDILDTLAACSKDPKTGKLKINARTKRHLVAQASAVMRVVGTCVAGLASIEDLVPRLRSVGTTHKIVGVQTMHYDILYRHLVNGIKEEVGPQNWDDETENAWEQAYLSITDLMKRPSKRLETEPLKGWGLVMLLACLYFTIVTPIRFAGFFIGRQYIITTLDILDTLAACSKDPKTGKLKINARTKRHLVAQASAVMRVVGTCVAGLASIEDLVPRLRSVGTTHKIVGVQTMHYDILYRHLVNGIKEEVGPQNWDDETENAWEQAYLSITDLMKRPSKRLETEPLKGWGLVMLLACLYFTIVTPIRFAGFFIGRQYIITTLDILDTLAACAMAFDFFIDFIQSKLRLKQQFVAELNDEESVVSGLSKKSRESVSIQMKRRRFIPPKLQNALLRRQKMMIKRLHRWNMDRWMPWPKLDVKFLLSFVLQGLFVRSSLCAQPGLHWTQLFGLLRLSCTSRVLHFVQCAENNALLRQQLSAHRQLMMRIIKLLVRLAFITHVSACLWCAVARVGLGVEATKFKASPFFPNPETLSYDNGRNVFNSYSRAIHWAFVNLSGIGGVESVPTTSLECWTVLVVHMCGAIFYAIVTGSVIAVLEEASQNENKIGSDIVKLSEFLGTARVSASSKERIIRGYMMRNVLTEGRDASGPVLDGLENGDEILTTLPNYLRAEVGIYARAETIRRRVKFFTHCSNRFLVALSSRLSRTRTLLTGDYLIQKGEQYDHEFMVVESGKLQVRKDGQTVHTLRRGDCIGKSWLMGDKDHSSTMGLRADGTASVSIRALTPCIVMGGLTTRGEVEKLEKSYAVDFKLLRAEARGHNKDENEKKAIAMRGLAKAVRRFKQRRMQRQEEEEAALECDGSASANEALAENFFNVSHDDLLRVGKESD